MTLQPGVDWHAKGTEPSAAPAAVSLPASTAPAIDPRQARIEAACQTLDAQLAAAPEAFREVLGDPGRTIQTLRKTALALLTREATLRRESGPERLSYLESERAGLSRRIEAETDAAIQKSLRGAVAAIDDQLQQRRALARHADRLDAEVTRLAFTLEGMGAQLVRLQSAGADAAAQGDAMGASLQSLHDEVEAIVSALEEMAQPETAARVPPAVVDVGAPSSTGSRDRERA
jgi:chromosome segregation ATPase